MKNFPQNNREEQEISDEVLIRFLDAKEDGKSFPEALLLAGVTDPAANLSAFHALWDMHGNLMREAHNMSPQQSLLSRTLSSLSHPATEIVTDSANLGYNGGSAQNVFVRIIYNFHTMSQMNWKIAAPVAILLLAVVAVVSVGGDGRSSKKLAVNTSPSAEPALMDAGGITGGTSESVGVPATDTSLGESVAKSAPAAFAAPATGEVDDLVTALVGEASVDVSLLDTASSDLSLVMTDSQALNDLNTAYDETTF